MGLKNKNEIASLNDDRVLAPDPHEVTSWERYERRVQDVVRANTHGGEVTFDLYSRKWRVRVEAHFGPDFFRTGDSSQDTGNMSIKMSGWSDLPDDTTIEAMIEEGRRLTELTEHNARVALRAVVKQSLPELASSLIKDLPDDSAS